MKVDYTGDLQAL